MTVPWGETYLRSLIYFAPIPAPLHLLSGWARLTVVRGPPVCRWQHFRSGAAPCPSVKPAPGDTEGDLPCGNGGQTERG